MAFPTYARYNRRPTITSNVPVTTTQSRSLITYARLLPSQRWEIEADVFVPPALSGAMNAFIASQNGGLTPFDWYVTGWGSFEAQNTTTTASASAGSTSVTISRTQGVSEGDYFNFGNHSKAYMVTGVSGSTITFFPALFSNIVNGQTVEFENPIIRARFRDSAQTFRSESFHAPVEYAISMVEVL